MKKYSVKFYVVDYLEKSFEIEANSAREAYEIAHDKSENGEGEFNLVHWKTWKKPTVAKIKKA